MTSLLLGPEETSALAPQRSPFLWLVEREVLRYLRIWRYALVGPILSTVLFVIVFGTILSRRIDVGGISYGRFIVPGLIAQTVLNVGYFNGTTSLFEARRDRYLNDVLASPLRWWEINAALVLAAALRGLISAAAVMAVAVPLTGIGVERPGYALLAGAGLLLLTAQVGVVAGTLARSLDHIHSIESLVILPLGFFGGIFYPLHQLAPKWRWLSEMNPFFWLVQATREAFLGFSDVPAWAGLAVVWAAALAVSGWAAYLFGASRRLKP